jgi:tetratricopeptide (TPR) repeat protein
MSALEQLEGATGLGAGGRAAPGDRCDRCGGVVQEEKGPDGLCARCRSLAAVTGPGEEAGPSGDREWRVSNPDGVIQGPLTLAEVKLKFQAGEIGAADKLARGEGDFRLISSYPEFAMFFRRPGESLQTMYRPTPPSHALRNILIVLFLLLAGGGYALYHFWPTVSAYLIAEERSSSIVEDALEVFSRDVPSPTGTSVDAVTRGRELMLRDERLGYMEADRQFKMALILDPTNLSAYAGWVQNRALLDLGAGEVKQRKVALDLVDHALERAPDMPELLRAKAFLFYSLGRINEARELSTRAAALLEDDPETMLVQGATYLESSTELAVDLFSKALEKNQQLYLAYRMLGEAKIRLGRFQEALSFFRKRLEKDPGQFASMDAIARVYLSVGKFDSAKEIYEQILGGEPHRVEAALALARLQYQFQGGTRPAARLIDRMLKMPEAEIGSLGRAQLLAERSVLLRLQGKPEQAVAAVEEALRLDPMLIPALYSQAWLAMVTGDLGQALIELRALRSHLPESARVLLLIAEVEAAVPHFEAAIKEYQLAIEAAPTDLDAYLMFAGLHLELDNPNQAYSWLRKATKVYPFFDRTHRALTAYYDGPSLLAVASRRAEQGADKYGDDALAQALAGAILWRAEQTDKGQARLQRALGLDEECFPANLYLGAIMLDAGQARRAVGYLKAAHKADALHPTASILLAYAHLQTGNSKEAEKLIKAVLKADPGDLNARLCMGEVQLARKQKKAAIKTLLKVYEGDNENVRAKEMLFQLGH